MAEPANSENSKIDSKPYLDYIDKEMTLCGVITAFSLACILFMMEKLFSVTKSDALLFNLDFKSVYFMTSLISLVIAAYLLFKLRTDLSYYHGQISLESSYPGYTGKTIKSLFDKVDAWEFWYKYFYGIAFIACAFIQLFVLVASSLYKGCPIADFCSQVTNSYFFSFIIIIVCMGLNCLIINNYKKQDQ